MERPPGFFQGSEFPRLIALAVVMVMGWALVWHFAKKRPQPAEPDPVATEKPEPIVADRSMEFETVTDRTSVGFRDDAAYALLLSRARDNSPAELAAVSRRDIFLPHLWQNPELYRGVPIHLLGTARRVLRYPCKLTRTGWIYEASIITPDATRNPFVCVFEQAPAGLPIGPNLSERVVFNGYFLKIWKYQASDVRAVHHCWSAGSAGTLVSLPAPTEITRPCAGHSSPSGSCSSSPWDVGDISFTGCSPLRLSRPCYRRDLPPKWLMQGPSRNGPMR